MKPEEITNIVSEFLKSIEDRPICKGRKYGKDCQHVSSYLPRVAKYFYPNETMTIKMLLKTINQYGSYMDKPIKFTNKKVYKETTYSKPRKLAYVIAIKSTTVTLDDTINLEFGDLFIIGPNMKEFTVFGREFIVLS